MRCHLCPVALTGRGAVCLLRQDVRGEETYRPDSATPEAALDMGDGGNSSASQDEVAAIVLDLEGQDTAELQRGSKPLPSVDAHVFGVHQSTPKVTNAWNLTPFPHNHNHHSQNHNYHPPTRTLSPPYVPDSIYSS